MKQVLLSQGQTVVANVPTPEVGDDEILVSVDYSCISGGTEGAAVSQSQEPLVKRALKHPENVIAALNLIRDEGVGNGLRKIKGILQNYQTLGYSAVGVVVAVGANVIDFNSGDIVACAGAGIANHAEYISVPVNLAVKLQADVNKVIASTVTLGAIALQGVRRANPQIGETVAVIGLGVLGQITAQLLKLNGCNTVAIDMVDGKCKVAREKGVFATSDEDVFFAQIEAVTDGEGVDCAIICASGSSNSIVSNAARACRKKGRVVLVGDVGLDLKREDFYSKELDFLISTSYGPGRYDPTYEQQGIDYPYAYVRWTENRNMSAYLKLVQQGKIDLENIISEPIPVNQAASAFEHLGKSNQSAFLFILDYQNEKSPLNSSIDTNIARTFKQDVLNVCLVGAGSFAQAVHLPNFNKLRNKFRIVSVVSKTGVTGANIAKSYHIDSFHTDYQKAIDDAAVDVVFICAPHDKHSEIVSYSLSKKKSVFVEKPLCLNEKELGDIEDICKRQEQAFLMVGYNRRFSPLMRNVKKHLDQIITPKVVTYVMNAGKLPKGHWAKSREQGGRNIGEACHIYDLFGYLIGARPISGSVVSVGSIGSLHNKSENFSVSLKYEDGSVCNLVYSSLGSSNFPKESMKVLAGGSVLEMIDYRRVEIYGPKGKKVIKSNHQDKGHLDELKALYDSLCRRYQWPISVDEILTTSKISFLIEQKIQANDLSEFVI